MSSRTCPTTARAHRPTLECPYQLIFVNQDAGRMRLVERRRGEGTPVPKRWLGEDGITGLEEGR